MFGLNTAKTRNPSMVGNLALSILLASCGGEGDGSTVEGPSSASQPATPATGQLTVTVTDPDGEPLVDARVQVENMVLGTDRNGMAIFYRLPAMAAQVSATHALGYREERVEIRHDGSTNLAMVIAPLSPTTVALFPVSVPTGGLSADRTELDLQFSLVASVTGPFDPELGTSWIAPFLRIDDCSVFLDSRNVTPSCVFGGDKEMVSVLDYSFDPFLADSSSTAPGPYSALLLLDQSRGAAKYDPYDRRTYAARHFIRRARTAPQADLIAVAGFAGSGGGTYMPFQLLQSPLWFPSGTEIPFTSDRLSQEAAVGVLRPLVGGTAPVLDALGAAMTVMAAQAPADRRRVIVALLGGADDSGLTEAQQQVALESLRQQQAETGIQVILIAARLKEGSEDRRILAELAAALRAPIIHAGYPGSFEDQTDGLYAALDLAADLSAGSALSSVKAVFRMKSNVPGGFQSGTVLHGAIYVQSDICDWECLLIPQEFAVRVP
jgi:hypothetical protein